jgi:spore photoproduct lyase
MRNDPDSAADMSESEVKGLIRDFESNGYEISIEYTKKGAGKCDLTPIIKAVKSGSPALYLSVIPSLHGERRLSIIRVSDGSIIERFMHIKVPPEECDDIVCPNFLELKWAYGCPFSCAYCYLQGTLRLLPTKKRPMAKDPRKVKRQLTSFLEAPLREAELLNAGELCDSLMFEGTQYSIAENILPLFEDATLNKAGHKVLLVTKSDKIEHLLERADPKAVVASFSINTENVFKVWEKGAAHPSSRLKAAEEAQNAGFEVRIRIDPIIPFPQASWRGEYCKLIDGIFNSLHPSRITLGTLRGLRTTIRKAGDKTWIKFIESPSKWGLKPRRETRYEIYKAIIDYLYEEYGYRDFALCKEDVEMWQNLGLDWKKCKCNCI